MTRTEQAGLLAVVLVGVFAYGNCRESIGAERERLAARTQQLADSLAWADSLEAERRRVDSLVRVSETVRTREIAAFRQRATRAERRVDSLAAHVPELQEALSVERAAKDSIIRQLEIRADVFFGRWRAADSAAARFRGLAESWQRQAELQRDRPGILESARRALPWMALSVLVWEIAR